MEQLRKYILWPGVFVLALSGGAVTSAPPRQAAPVSRPPLRFRAVLGQTGWPNRSLLFDQGRYRLEQHTVTKPGDPHPHNELFVQLFDGCKPHITWHYHEDQIAKRRSARPAPDSISPALDQSARQNGEAVTRQRYGLPASYRFRKMRASLPFGNDLLQMPSAAQLLTAKRPGETAKRVGVGRVAGYACQVYERRVVPAHPFGTLLASGQGFAGNPILTWRLWVEPRSGLVLKEEDRQEFPANSPVPPQRQVYQVLSLQFLTAPVPLARFQLPPGTVAHVPALFRDARLPKGVTRSDEPGCGMDVRIFAAFR